MNQIKICETCGVDKTYLRPAGTEEWKKTETGHLCKSCYMKNYNFRTYVSKPRDIPHGPCVKCNSKTTYVRPNRKTPDWTKTEIGFICKSCSSKEYNSRTYVPRPKTPLSGPCVECDNETTCIEKSGYPKWYRGPDGTICKKCFNRKNDKVLKPGLCVKCGIVYTKHGWCKTDKGTICQTCYRSYYTKLERKGNCSICKTTTSNGWGMYEPHGRICKQCSSKLRVRKIKVDTLSHYSNGSMRCATCEYSKNINALELDHIEGNGNKNRKKFNKTGGWSYYRKLQTLEYPTGYQVLCSNCNKIKQIEVDPKGS
jgi:hypothetical protein